MKIKFAIQSYQHKSLPVSAQSCVNMYAEAQPPDANTQVAVLPTPGVELINTLGIGPIHAIEDFRGVYYIISGDELYSMRESGVAQLLGNVGNARQIVNNGYELFIPSDLQGYNYDEVNGFREVPAGDFLGASTSTSQDGYVINAVPNSGVFQISTLQDAYDYSNVQYATAEGHPDGIIRVLSDHRELWLMGESTIEVWYNSGDTDFPFDRSTYIERGCGGRWTVQKLDNTVYWLGNDKVVYTANGYQPVRISTHAIESEIKEYTSEPTSYIQEWDGHKFYILSYTESTWAYDVATKLWHQRQSYGLERSRINVISGDIAGDYINGNIYRVTDSNTENGETIQRIMVSPAVGSFEKFTPLSKLSVEFEAGVGLTSGQGNDPLAILAWSDDMGATWSNSLYTPIGKIGEYGWRAEWHRLGRFRKRIFKLIVSDPVKVVILGAYAQ
ncbi:MAG: packaged DNA stabilization protein gp10 [Candidatus Thiodiazotropha sp. (ex Troendleina suluensis)]|nr:packaged DNA stabilization protein gp10 [Candidatus Thiodiazotropha sp. (ex Troendleina suluensis)]